MSKLINKFPNAKKFGRVSSPVLFPGDDVVVALPPIVESILRFTEELVSRAPAFDPSEASEFLREMEDVVFVGKLVSRQNELLLLENRFGVRRKFPVTSVIIIGKRTEIP